MSLICSHWHYRSEKQDKRHLLSLQFAKIFINVKCIQSQLEKKPGASSTQPGMHSYVLPPIFHGYVILGFPSWDSNQVGGLSNCDVHTCLQGILWTPHARLSPGFSTLEWFDEMPWERLLRRLLSAMFTACLVLCCSSALWVSAERWAFGITPQHRYKSFVKSCGWGWMSRTSRWETISPWVLLQCLRYLCCVRAAKKTCTRHEARANSQGGCVFLVITLTSCILLGSEHLVLPLSKGNWGHWSSHRLLGINI